MIGKAELRLLIRLSAVIASGSEIDVRRALDECYAGADPARVEEVILQSHLFCGFPRALNAMREWRRITGLSAQENAAESQVTVEEWRERGEKTCATVYGDSYQQLRENVRRLHPALDEWMIIAGYGRVLSREGLELATRELCVVVACAASRQERQLHSHLHGALNAGVTPADVDFAIECIDGLLNATAMGRTRSLWDKVRQMRGGG